MISFLEINNNKNTQVRTSKGYLLRDWCSKESATITCIWQKTKSRQWSVKPLQWKEGKALVLPWLEVAGMANWKWSILWDWLGDNVWFLLVGPKLEKWTKKLGKLVFTDKVLTNWPLRSFAIELMLWLWLSI